MSNQEEVKSCKRDAPSGGVIHEISYCHCDMAEKDSTITDLKKENERLKVYHCDDEPSWRHRCEKLEKELLDLKAQVLRKGEALRYIGCRTEHNHEREKELGFCPICKTVDESLTPSPSGIESIRMAGSALIEITELGGPCEAPMCEEDMKHNNKWDEAMSNADKSLAALKKDGWVE